MADEASINEELKRRIQERLDAIDTNPFAAAESVGLNRVFIWDFLHGRKTSVTVDKLPRIALALETTVEYLIHGIGSAESDMKPSSKKDTTRTGTRKAVPQSKPTLAFEAIGDDKASIHVEATVPWDVAMTIVDLVKKSQVPA